MGKLIIINGSPRAPKSNSKIYSEIFINKYKGEVDYFNITKTNNNQIINKMVENNYQHLLFVFPLYADALPVGLLNFLKQLETNNIENKPTISIIINCGFFETKQNDIAIKIMKMFAKRNNYNIGSILRIASGEATPYFKFFKFLLTRKIKKFAKSLRTTKYVNLEYTMPISKKMFLKASTKYWIKYGERNKINQNEMSTMKIEGN